MGKGIKNSSIAVLFLRRTDHDPFHPSGFDLKALSAAMCLAYAPTLDPIRSRSRNHPSNPWSGVREGASREA